MPESQSIEYKRVWADEYLKQVCGFANAHGGRLLIGVDDDGSIVGIDNSKSLMDNLPNKINMNLGIIAEVNLLTEAGKEYIEIIVPKSNEPVAYHGKFYFRSGATNQELRGNALTRFLIRKTGFMWDAEPVDGITIDDLDKESFDIFKREALRRHRMEEDDLNVSREELLRKLKLLTDDGKLTRAAVLLFYREPEQLFQGAFVHIAMFRGSDILYMDELHGSLMIQADRILDLIYTKYMYMHISYYQNKTRMERYTVPQLALREALFNALMHSDYAQCNPIHVRIEDGNVTVSNSAQVPEGWTAETFLAPHESQPYNHNIANAFYRAGFVEKWGRGVSKMCDICTAEGNTPPTYTVYPTMVLIHFEGVQLEGLQKTLQKDENTTQKTTQKDENTTQKTTQKDEITTQKLTEQQTAILTYLAEHPSATRKEIGAVLPNITEDGIKYNLARLQELGIIRRVGGRKAGYWEIIREYDIPSIN